MKIKDITYVALFAAIMGALGLTPPIPLSFTPVPITLQTMGAILSGGILGARLGAWSQIVFLLVVAVGVPLLPGGRGGIGVFFGPSAGYLVGYVIVAVLVGYSISRFRTLTLWKVLLVNLTIGVFTIYLIGIPVQAFVMHLPLMKAIQVSLVFIPGDLIKAAIASYLVYKLRKSPAFTKQLSNNSGM